jgi:GNAT superfamily N-acetyltransferase
VASGLSIRTGDENDTELIVALFDEAIEWLVARGQPDQWGTQPWSERPGTRERARGFAASGGLRVALRDGEPVGVVVVGNAPPHVASAGEPELYVELLLTSRRHAGRDIGGMLVRRAVGEAHARGVGQLRVDCWAGAPRLVAWYQEQGFRPTEMFQVGQFIGQVFEMTLAPPA